MSETQDLLVSKGLGSSSWFSPAYIAYRLGSVPLHSCSVSGSCSVILVSNMLGPPPQLRLHCDHYAGPPPLPYRAKALAITYLSDAGSKITTNFSALAKQH